MPHVVVIVLGGAFVARGLVGLIGPFGCGGPTRLWWELLPAAAALTAGLALMGWPIYLPKSLGLVLVAFFLVEGSSSIAHLFEQADEFTDRGWLLLRGIVELAFAVAIVAGIPAAAAAGLAAMAGITMGARRNLSDRQRD